MMKNVGIWINKREAKIVTIDSGNKNLDKIVSNIEEFHIGGGSGSRLKGGPQDVVQDSKYLKREKQQMSEFFKNIVKGIADADAIVIFGPAQTGEKFFSELLKKHSMLYQKVTSVNKADNMTDNQIMAWVSNYYNVEK